MKPLVSILIPAYNAERWIADTIKSALAQTWPNKEIIVVDDGSTDQTLEIARRFASENVKVVGQVNQGASTARNRAFSLSQGDYIQWLDADDLLSADKISRQIEAAEQFSDKRMPSSCGWGYFMYRPNKAKFDPTLLWKDLTPLEWMLRKWEYNLQMQTATWLVSRELSEAAGPWDTRLSLDDDGEYFCRVIMRSAGIRFVPNVKVFYRMPDSRSLSYIGRSNRKMDSQFLSMGLQIGYLRSMKDDERVRAASITYLKMWLPIFYPNRPDIVEQAQQLAKSLGGQLAPPRLSWKYVWIQKTMGWNAAKSVQANYNQFRLSAMRVLDNTLLRSQEPARNGTIEHSLPRSLESSRTQMDHGKLRENYEVSEDLLSPRMTEAPMRAGDDGANDQHFRTDHLLADLKIRTVSSGVITVTAQGVQFALTLASTMVLARILMPRDFGLLAMVFTVMAFLRVFKETGLSTATVQREGITQSQVSNLFWVNVAVSGSVSVLVAAMAPVIAWFFREPRLVGITLALSPTFLLSGLAVQHMALLNRQMRFRAIALVQIGSVLAGVLVGISMAWQGCGYWSLAGLNVTTSAVALLLTWWSCRWRPNLFKRHSGTRSLVNFGAHLTAGSFLYSVARGLDGLLIGRFWGAHPLGLYSRASALLTQPMVQAITPIESVFIPTLSRLQTQPDRYRLTFLQVYEAIALTSFFFTGMCFSLAHPLTLVVLGPKWEKAAVIFAGFTFAALVYPLTTFASWLFSSQGRGSESFLAFSIISIVMAGSFIAGLPFGPEGVAIAFSVSCLLIQMPILYYLAGRRGPVSTGDLWIGLLKHLPVWVIVTVVAWLTRTAVLNFSPLAQLAICIPASLLAGAAFVFVYSPSRRVAANLFSLVQELKNPAGNSCPPSSLRSERRDIASAERLVQPMTSRFDSSAARKVESEIPAVTMKITVILCTYNRCGQLATVLECISNQRLPESVQWEVLVVDNNSRDETRKVVETFSDRHPGRFRYLFEAQQGKSYALNTGIREASGDILVFIDDDVMVEPMWLRNLTAALNTDGCAGIGGRVLPERAFSPPDWLSLDSGKIEGPLVIFDRGDVAGKLQEAPVGTNMAFHKKMFEKYGGFRTDMGPSRNSEIRGEDSEFGGRLLSKGERLRYEPSAIVYHSVPEERVQRKYFLAWWYDKGRSEVRELGMPPHTRWVIGGIPLYLFRRLAIWGLRWMISVQPARRFICKIEVWSVAGRIVEFHRRAKRLRNGE